MRNDLEATELRVSIRTGNAHARQRALDQLLRDWEPVLVAQARRFAPTPGSFHDYQQIARLALLRAAERYTGRPGGRFEWFARRVIRNALLDEAKRELRWRRRHACHDNLDISPGRYSDGLDSLLHQERCAVVRASLAHWSARLQGIIHLLYHQGHNQLEVASILGRSPARVSQLVHEIRQTGRRAFASIANDCQ